MHVREWHNFPIPMLLLTEGLIPQSSRAMENLQRADADLGAQFYDPNALADSFPTPWVRGGVTLLEVVRCVSPKALERNGLPRLEDPMTFRFSRASNSGNHEM